MVMGADVVAIVLYFGTYHDMCRFYTTLVTLSSILCLRRQWQKRKMAGASSNSFLPLLLKHVGDFITNLMRSFDGLCKTVTPRIHTLVGSIAQPLSVLTVDFCQRISVMLEHTQAQAIYLISLIVGTSAT